MTDQPETMFWENLANVAEDASIEWDDIVAVKDDYRHNLYQHAGMRMAEWVYANQSLLLEALAAAGVLDRNVESGYGMVPDRVFYMSTPEEAK